MNLSQYPKYKHTRNTFISLHNKFLRSDLKREYLENFNRSLYFIKRILIYLKNLVTLIEHNFLMLIIAYLNLIRMKNVHVITGFSIHIFNFVIVRMF